MQLQGRYRPHVVDAAFNGMGYRQRFVKTLHQYHHLPGIHDGTDPYGQSGGGNQRRVMPKEASVGQPSAVGQGLLPGARFERRAGFVEGDVAIFSHSTNE